MPQYVSIYFQHHNGTIQTRDGEHMKGSLHYDFQHPGGPIQVAPYWVA